jgi:ATP-dependent Clp protease adaptor protein ClpS
MSSLAAQVETGERTAVAEPKQATESRRAPLYHVVLLDDNEHTYEYVIEMLVRLFGHTTERGYQLACEVDTIGRAIVDTTTMERAELKRDQIRGYGRDWRLPNSRGSMAAVIEPAE